MNYLDIIIGIILIIFAIYGLKNGIIREAFSLIAFFAGIYGALHFSSFVGEKLGRFFGINSDIVTIISYIIVFVGLVILVNLIGKFLSSIAKTINLGFFDKMGGFFFGLAKGLVILGGFIMLIEYADIEAITKNKSVEKSGLYKLSKSTAEYVYNYRDTIEEKMKKGFDKTDEFIENVINIDSK